MQSVEFLNHAPSDTGEASLTANARNLLCYTPRKDWNYLRSWTHLQARLNDTKFHSAEFIGIPMTSRKNSISTDKGKLLEYFRHRAEESLDQIRLEFGEREFKKHANAINKHIAQSRDILISTILQEAKKGGWASEETLQSILLTTYTSYVSMIESRNSVWPYEYMAFSRRIGELWEPFCRLCFEYPVREIELFIPPLFSEARKQLSEEIENYIDDLDISTEQKNDLKQYYQKVWKLVASGEIKLELDLHFISGDTRYVVDFKSGFGSNEKGNTNRLLLVGSIYKAIAECYKCVLLVRALEDANNNYFQTIKRSGIWDAHCGREAYSQMRLHSGFDILGWIEENVSWEQDFDSVTYQHFVDSGLEQYLNW